MLCWYFSPFIMWVYLLISCLSIITISLGVFILSLYLTTSCWVCRAVNMGQRYFTVKTAASCFSAMISCMSLSDHCIRWAEDRLQKSNRPMQYSEPSKWMPVTQYMECIIFSLIMTIVYVDALDNHRYSFWSLLLRIKPFVVVNKPLV